MPKNEKTVNSRGDRERPEKEWELRLYVAGQTSKAMAAFANLKKICEEHLEGGAIPHRDHRFAQAAAACPGRSNRGGADPGAETAGTGAEDYRGPVRYGTRLSGSRFEAADLRNLRVRMVTA